MGNLGYPYTPTHPGEILKEEIEYRGISQKKLAEQIGISYTMLNEILNAKRPVTETMALYFEAALGIEAEMLTNMQTRYNMQTARKDSKLTARLQQIRKLAAILRKIMSIECIAAKRLSDKPSKRIPINTYRDSLFINVNLLFYFTVLNRQSRPLEKSSK